jgi:thymidylate synthase
MKYTHEDGTPFSKEELKTDKEFNDEFGNKGIDQISELIKQLKENPDSRRLLISAWNASDLPHQVLPPCHYGFQVYTRELSLNERIDIRRKETKDGTVDYDNRNHNYLDHFNVPKRAISLMFNMRSVDTFLGLPFNIASYGLLLEIIAKEVNMVPEELIGNLGDVHLYNNHIEQAKEQLTRTPFELPTLKINFDVVHKDWECLPPYNASDFVIENYQSHPAIKGILSN